MVVVLGGPGKRCVVLMNQSSRDYTLLDVRPSPGPDRGAVSPQSSRDKRPKHSLPGSTVRREGRAISTLKERLRADLTAAMKSRDELVKSTLRMTLTAVHNVEVAGTQARELDDAEVLQVIAKEAKKRAESAEAFAAAGRDEMAAQERTEGEILARYLPQQLSDDELAAVARDAVAAVEAQTGQAPRPRQMGLVMKQAQAAAAGRADGKRVAAAVKALLAAPQ
jgi:uncharacterized protein YqeY